MMVTLALFMFVAWVVGLFVEQMAFEGTWAALWLAYVFLILDMSTKDRWVQMFLLMASGMFAGLMRLNYVSIHGGMALYIPAGMIWTIATLSYLFGLLMSDSQYVRRESSNV